MVNPVTRQWAPLPRLAPPCAGKLPSYLYLAFDRPGRLAALQGVLDAGCSQLVVCTSRRLSDGEIRMAAVAVRDTGVLVEDRALGGEVVSPARGASGNHGRHGAG